MCAHSVSTISERHACMCIHIHKHTYTDTSHSPCMHAWKKFSTHVQLHAAWTEVTTTVHLYNMFIYCVAFDKSDWLIQWSSVFTIQKVYSVTCCCFLKTALAMHFSHVHCVTVQCTLCHFASLLSPNHWRLAGQSWDRRGCDQGKGVEHEKAQSGAGRARRKDESTIYTKHGSRTCLVAWVIDVLHVIVDSWQQCIRWYFGVCLAVQVKHHQPSSI